MQNPPLNSEAVAAPPPQFLPPKTLRGKHITLQPLAELSAKNFAELHKTTHGDPAREQVWQYLPYGPFPSPAAMQQCYEQLPAAGDPQFYAVRHAPSDAPAGVVSYLRISPAAYSVEIGHIWHAAARQRGFANSEAAFLLLENAFAAGYRRVEWKCNAQNHRSRAAALRLGFAFEGVFRRHLVIKNKNRDTAWFALIAEDWPAAKKNITAYLAAPPGKFSLSQKNLPLVAWSIPAHDAWQ